jgi:hypothetical protein
MKEIPILFSTPMVHALLAGRKTMTRRIIKAKYQPVRDEVIDGERMIKPVGWPLLSIDEFKNRFCPYGKPGDLLWVRETWAPYLRGTDDNGSIDLIKYKADGAEIPFKHIKDYSELGWHNRPGIHMNKEYARIWLQVTDIRVERLQDITETDAQAEGMEKMDDSPFPYKLYSCNTASCVDAKTSFKFLWMNINGDGSWNENPWVWVVSFNILSATGKPSSITAAEVNRRLNS